MKLNKKFFSVILLVTVKAVASPSFPPESITAEAFGQTLTPDEVCHKFNSMVDRSNQWLQMNDYSESVISKDLCSVVRVETSYPTHKYYDIQEASRWGYSNWEYWLDETVDIVEDNAVLILSSKSGDIKRTRYMLYSNNSADLVKQEGAWNYSENIGEGNPKGDNRYLFTQTGQESTSQGVIKPTYWWALRGVWKYIISNTWHGSQFRSFLVDGSNKELINEANRDVGDFMSSVGINNPTQSDYDRNVGEFLWRKCVGKVGEPDPRCLPGGSENSTSFSTRNSYPNSDGADSGNIQISSSSEVSVGLSGSVGVDSDGPSAGLDVSVGQSFSTSYSDDIKVMELDKMSMRNNLGANWTYRLNPAAVKGLYGTVALENELSGGEGRVNNANATLGEGSWKTLDMSSQYDWAEINNSQNCVNGTTREMWFVTAHDVTRGSLKLKFDLTVLSEDITHKGGYRHNRQPLDGIAQSQIIKVDTVCDEGFRYHKRGLLNSTNQG
ncbi:hypothetical protein A165_10080 [Vibrio tasmaniensis ZS-17]|uniref:Uncharacterized protein n=1 Tax=Vibrio lentus TaxID=136468 RepID=A0A2N7IJB0_9VIBR|nr:MULTISPECIES: hypothetical protein [Vibrio]OED64131.1 hypothetical protein A165_10080 [Vibrio tasmaniensis ZS-17]PMH96194.1 hypothetical protein BCU54_13010 [Vibrio lentus]PML57736.1 hypothetical protein BCT74_17705 [Vibrio lentus]